MRSGGGDGGESALPNDGGDKPDVSVKNAEGEVRPAAEDGRGRGAVQLLPKGAQEESSAGLPPRGQGQLGDRDQLVEVPAEGKGKGEGLKASPPASYHQRGRSLGDAQPPTDPSADIPPMVCVLFLSWVLFMWFVRSSLLISLGDAQAPTDPSADVPPRVRVLLMSWALFLWLVRSSLLIKGQEA